MTNWYLPDGLVYRKGRLRAESVLVLGGQIAAFGAAADRLRAESTEKIRDFSAKGFLICRGFIDFHTHLREPGFEAKGDIASETKAAAAGGFTSVCPMPNTNPPLDSVAELKKLEGLIAAKARVKVHPIAALTKGRQGAELVDYAAFKKHGVHLFSDDGDPLEDDLACLAFQKVHEAGGILINHLEDKSLVQRGFFYEEIPPESEYSMLARDLKLAAQTNCPYHAAHLSCAESVELIETAKKQGVPVTAEVTPHHLTLTFEDIKKPWGHFQMKPPLRQRKDRAALVQGLAAGTVDLVATDHAPHGEEKEKGLYPTSPFGVTGLETAFPVLYTKLVLAGKLTLERLLAALTAAPAALLNEPPGLAPGMDADLVVLDLQAERAVGEKGYYSKGTNSPFAGEALRGWPVLTLVSGKERYSAVNGA
ncbi:MAG TPA: dihydroorotase [Firmicutes bacterium]|nr:dihydroorotase [Bacillota bacterium]